MMTNRLVTYSDLRRTVAVMLIAASALFAPFGIAAASEEESLSNEPPETWTVAIEDMTLRGVISRWSQLAGWKLHWDAPIDVPIIESVEYRMPLASALSSLLTQVSEQGPVFQATFYSKNNVLRISAQPTLD